MASIFSLYGNIFVDNEEANKKIEETTNKGKKSSKSFAESFTDMSKKAMAIGTAVVGATTAIVGTVTAVASNVAATTDEIDKMSQRLGMSREGYQEWDYVLSQAGVDINTMQTGMKSLVKNMDAVTEGNKTAISNFEKLGLSVTDSTGKMKSQEVMFNETVTALQNMEDGTEKARLAQELFGKQGQEMLPLLNGEAGSVEELKNKAHELGMVLNDDAIDAGVEFTDTMDTLKKSFSGAGASLMGSVMPILNKFLNMIIDKMPEISKMLNKIAPVLVGLLESIFPILFDFAEQIFPILFDLINQLMPIISSIVENVLPIFADILQIILPPLVQIIEALLPPLMEILNALIPVLEPIFDLLLFVTDTVLKPIITVLTSIVNIIANNLVTAFKILTPVITAIKTVFENVFGGLIEIVKKPINFIIDILNGFIGGLNKIKIPDWVPGVGGKGLNIPLIAKLRTGLDYVPYDEMPALLHKGEAVLSKDDAQNYRNNNVSKEETINNNYNNIFNIEKLEVKNENDIKRIAEELYYLQKKAVI